MKNQPILILVVSLLITFSLKLYAEDVNKIEINNCVECIIYTNDGVESTIVDTNSDSLTLSTDSQETNNESQLLISKYEAELEGIKNQLLVLSNEKKELVPIMSSKFTDSLNTKKQSKYYLSTGFGKIKNDTIASFSAGYKLHPNLSLEAGIITSADVYSIKSTSTAADHSGTAGSKAYTITNTTAGLKVSTNTSYLAGVNYSLPLINLNDLVPNLELDKNLNFYTKGGVLFWGVDYSLTLDGTVTFDGVTYSPSGSIPFAKAKGSDIYYGIGVSYPLTNETSIRADYTKTEIAGVKIGGFSGSAVFEF